MEHSLHMVNRGTGSRDIRSKGIRSKGIRLSRAMVGGMVEDMVVLLKVLMEVGMVVDISSNRRRNMVWVPLEVQRSVLVVDCWVVRFLLMLLRVEMMVEVMGVVMGEEMEEGMVEVEAIERGLATRSCSQREVGCGYIVDADEGPKRILRFGKCVRATTFVLARIISFE